MTADSDPDTTEPHAPPDEGVLEQEQTDAAARQAGAIGGTTGEPDMPESERPLAEAGEGESEGFEQAELDLTEHASHGDQHAARRAILDADHRAEEQGETADGAEADHSETSEAQDDGG
jgi:hypothetical protein